MVAAHARPYRQCPCRCLKPAGIVKAAFRAIGQAARRSWLAQVFGRGMTKYPASVAAPTAGRGPFHRGDVAVVRSHQELRGLGGPRGANIGLPLEVSREVPRATSVRYGRTRAIARRERRDRD